MGHKIIQFLFDVVPALLVLLILITLKPNFHKEN